jgi:hypothetical protein
MKKFWKGFLFGLATVLGFVAAAVLIILRSPKYRIQAIAEVTVKEIQSGEKVSEEEHNQRLGEVQGRLLAETVDEVLAEFRKTFGVEK